MSIVYTHHSICDDLHAATQYLLTTEQVMRTRKATHARVLVSATDGDRGAYWERFSLRWSATGLTTWHEGREDSTLSVHILIEYGHLGLLPPLEWDAERTQESPVMP